jgi:putative ABC transport system substrate-binding protein
MEVDYREIQRPADIEAAFKRAIKEHAGALLVLSTALNFAQQRQIAGIALNTHLPAIYGSSEYTESGGLMSYGVNFVDLFRRAASYVDKILKGASQLICQSNSRRSSSW